MIPFKQLFLSDSLTFLTSYLFYDFYSLMFKKNSRISTAFSGGKG